MKLYDELVAVGPLVPFPNRANYDSFDVLAATVRFDASNVSKYLQRHTMSPSDIPSIRPPFDQTWWETGVSINEYTQRHGAAAYVTSWGDGMRYAIDEGDYSRSIQERMAGEVYWTVFMHNAPVSAQKTPGGYAMRGGVQRKPQYEIGIPMDEFGRPFVDEDGRIVARDLSANPLLHRSDLGSYDHLLREEQSGRVPGFTVAGWRRDLVDHAMPYIWPFLVAIGFSHCKNVEMVEAPELPYKIQRKQELKIGRPLAKFKELVIDPSMSQKRYIDPQRPESEEKHQKSLHIVRGHFATYGDDRKLFGKYTGTFWKPAHTRGTDEVGTVYKDYLVKSRP